jgi:hypothetical protein
MDPSRTQARLGDGETVALITEQIGHRDVDVVEDQLAVAVLILVTEDTGRCRTISTPGVSLGTRTMDYWRCGSAPGSVFPMTMYTLLTQATMPCAMTANM